MKKFMIASGVAVLAFASIAGAQGYSFTSDLTVGSTGPDVVALQNWLIANGYSIPAIQSGAAATGYFGSQTQAAVKAYQAAHNVPSTGFFGPLTRASLNAGGAGTVVVQPIACPAGYVCQPVGGSTNTGTNTNTGALQGGEGQLDNFDLIGSISDESVDEGEKDAQVLGVEFDAEDSDLRIDRVDVDFTAPDSGSDHLDDYINSVSLWLGSTKLATLDVDEADEDDNVFSFRFSGLNGVVREDDTASLYVAVNAVNNVDSEDTGSWTVEIPVDGIRATDAAGISDTYVSSSDNLSETFDVGAANAGELDVTEADSNPDAGIITADEDNDTSDVTLLVIDLEADESDVNVDALPVGFVANGATVSQILKNVKLVRGSTVLDSKSISASAGTSYQVTFDDLDLDIEDGDTETLKVVATVNNFDSNFGEGDSIYATTTGSNSKWDVEDANGDDVDPDGSVTGNAQTFYSDGLGVTLVDTDVKSDTSGVATFEISFDVKANGSDIYLSANSPDLIAADATPSGTNVGLQYSTSTSAAGTGYISSDDFLATLTSSDVVGSYYKINQGQTRSFKLQVVMSNNSTTTLAKDGIALRSINWSTSTDSNGFINHYTFNLNSFITDPLSWKTAP